MFLFFFIFSSRSCRRHLHFIFIIILLFQLLHRMIFDIFRIFFHHTFGFYIFIIELYSLKGNIFENINNFLLIVDWYFNICPDGVTDCWYFLKLNLSLLSLRIYPNNYCRTVIRAQLFFYDQLYFIRYKFSTLIISNIINKD